MRRISRKEIAEEYGLSVRTVDRRLREMERLAGTRYPDRAVVRTPSIRIWDKAIRDFMDNREMILQGIAPAFTGR